MQGQTILVIKNMSSVHILLGVKVRQNHEAKSADGAQVGACNYAKSQANFDDIAEYKRFCFLAATWLTALV